MNVRCATIKIVKHILICKRFINCFITQIIYIKHTHTHTKAVPVSQTTNCVSSAKKNQFILFMQKVTFIIRK